MFGNEEEKKDETTPAPAGDMGGEAAPADGGAVEAPAADGGMDMGEPKKPEEEGETPAAGV